MQEVKQDPSMKYLNFSKSQTRNKRSFVDQQFYSRRKVALLSRRCKFLPPKIVLCPEKQFCILSSLTAQKTSFSLNLQGLTNSAESVDTFRAPPPSFGDSGKKADKNLYGHLNMLFFSLPCLYDQFTITRGRRYLDVGIRSDVRDFFPQLRIGRVFFLFCRAVALLLLQLAIS